MIWKPYCSQISCLSIIGFDESLCGPRRPDGWYVKMVTIKSSQKTFTEEEISSLTGICLEDLRSLARSRHLGSFARAAEAAGEQAGKWLFTNSDLMVLAILFPRCHH